MSERSRVNNPEEMAPDYVRQLVALPDRLVVLSAKGEMYERVADPRDFAHGPNHRGGYTWRKIKGPFDDA